jgi:hypothetical protein
MATRPYFLGMSPFDWVLTGGVLLLFALTLAARVWVKAAEPGLLRLRRERSARAGAEVLPDFPDPREHHGAPSVRRSESDELPTRFAAR